MNKEQFDDPSVDLIRVKNMFNTPFHELPRCCTVMAEYSSLWKHSEQLRQRL